MSASFSSNSRRALPYNEWCREHSHSSDYYDRLPVKPGADFWGCLVRYRADAQRARIIVQRAFESVSFADTVCVSSPDCVAIIRDGSFVRYIEDHSLDSFAKLVGSQKPNEPVAVSRRRVGETDLTSALSVTGLNASIRSGSNPIVFQRYVKFRGLHASSFRVLYSPGKSLTGFRRTSRFKKPACIDEWNCDRLSQVFLATGNLCRLTPGALSDSTAAAKGIFYLIQNFFNLNLESVLIDLVPDMTGTPCFVSVRGFSLKQSIGPGNFFENIPTSTEIETEERRKRFADFAVKKIPCDFCKCHLSGQTKRVTHRFVKNLVQGLRSRGNSLPEGLSIKVDEDLEICSLCYSLCLAEREVVFFARQMSLLLTKGLVIDRKGVVVGQGRQGSLPDRSMVAANQHTMKWRFFCLVKNVESQNLPVDCFFRFSLHLQNVNFSIQGKTDRKGNLEICTPWMLVVHSEQAPCTNAEFKLCMGSKKSLNFHGKIALEGIAKGDLSLGTQQSCMVLLIGEPGNFLFEGSPPHFIHLYATFGLICDGKCDEKIPKNQFARFPLPEMWLECVVHAKKILQKSGKIENRPTTPSTRPASGLSVPLSGGGLRRNFHR